MKLAAIQYKPPHAQPHQARAELLELITEAGRQGADLIVCPEMATSGYLWEGPRDIAPFAEPSRGPSSRIFGAAARAYGAWIVCGLPEVFIYPGSFDPTGKGRRLARFYNAALVIGPDGSLVTCYRKIMLYESDGTWATPGRRRLVVPTDFGRLAPAICMDINDPDFSRFVRTEQPAVVAFCTNWISEGIPVHEYWSDCLRGWRGWLVAANTWGQEKDTVFSGESAIISPEGEVVAKARVTGNQVLLVDTD